MRLMVAFFAHGGWLRAEQASWALRAGAEIPAYGYADASVVVVNMTPTPVARNRVVKAALEAGIDRLLMIDHDNVPHPMWLAAATELLADGPGVVAAPYCGPINDETGREVDACFVMEWQTMQADGPPSLRAISRSDAANRTGVSQAGAVPTGCSLWSLEIFSRIERPWFAYQMDADQTELRQYEDLFCTRRLAAAGVPLYVTWDYWADHYKQRRLTRPVALSVDEIRRRLEGV